MFNVGRLAATLGAREAQQLRGGARNVADNLHIDAVVQELEDSDRNDRAICREAQWNAAAPDNNPGDDDSVCTVPWYNQSFIIII